MKSSCFLFMLLLAFLHSCKNTDAEKQIEYAIVLHGGAGNINPENLPPHQQQLYSEMLGEVLDLGLSLLKAGSSSLDVVEAVVCRMEDTPLFNAGKGAVFNHEGRIELDASIMDGSTLNAGAVAAVSTIKNPVRAARKVMENSQHVLLTGKGAEEFAGIMGLEIVPNEYFYTQRRYEELLRILKNQGEEIDSLQLRKFGTVGCVALDKNGNIAAATSTGGRANKMYGRIGDTPLIGAGNYANNKTCGVSGTGHGEFFIRYVVSHEISALMQYKGMNVQQAAYEVIHNQLKLAEGEGGVICLDNKGNVAMEFNTSGMYRAYGNSSGSRGIKIFKD